MRVLVCGSRDWGAYKAVHAMLTGIAETLDNDEEEMVVIQGGANGADAWAAKWADWYGAKSLQFNANWTLGRAAGPVRNTQMLSSGKPDLVVAFKSRPISKGTDDMIAKAKAAGVPVWVVSPG